MYHASAELIEENVTKINGEVTINVNVSGKIIIYVKKDHIWNPATYSCKNRKYLASIIDHSVIMCDEIIDMDAGHGCRIQVVRQRNKNSSKIYNL